MADIFGEQVGTNKFCGFVDSEEIDVELQQLLELQRTFCTKYD